MDEGSGYIMQNIRPIKIFIECFLGTVLNLFKLI